MTRAIVDRSGLVELLRAASADAEVWAPAPTSSGGEPAVELEADALDRLTLEYSNTRQSVKRLFFPQTEIMLRFEAGATTPAGSAQETASARALVVFGVRPCDAMALTYLDKVFLAGLTKYGDPYYSARRERSLIVAYACRSPCSTCFCTAVGGDPAGTAGADVLARDATDGRLLLDAVTAGGRSFLAAHRALLAEAPTEAAPAGLDAPVPALATPTGRAERDPLKARMDKAFEDPVWNRLTESCIGCGACTYLCPTCHCFDISDEERMYRGRRIRTWDSCQYPLFTKHASGHNPRPARKHRLRQRFMHKFSYTLEKSGDVYCVGCGRCVTHCPVNLDIREVIRAFSAPGA